MSSVERLNEKCDAEFFSFGEKSRGKFMKMLVGHVRDGTRKELCVGKAKEFNS
jgi:hypothetical protein